MKKKYICISDVTAHINTKITNLRAAQNDKNLTEYEKGVLEGLEGIFNFLETLETMEVDLKNSMVCKVDWYDGFLLDYTQEQQDELLEKIGADVGDKIRVILIKE